MDIQTFHRYNRLVRRGLCKPLLHVCGNEYTLRATLDGDPVLQCFSCNSKTQPGLQMFREIKSVVDEFYVPGDKFTFDGEHL